MSLRKSGLVVIHGRPLSRLVMCDPVASVVSSGGTLNTVSA